MTAEAMVGIGVGSLVAAVAIVAVVVTNSQAMDVKNLQGADEDVSKTLTRIDRGIEDASSVVYATANDLVIETTDPDEGRILTRWVMAGDKFYRQVWTSPPATYPANHATAWANPAVKQAGATGGGSQTSYLSASNVKASSKYEFVDAKGVVISASTPLTGAGAVKIAKVKTILQTGVTDTRGNLENKKTSTLRAGSATAQAQELTPTEAPDITLPPVATPTPPAPTAPATPATTTAPPTTAPPTATATPPPTTAPPTTAPPTATATPVPTTAPPKATATPVPTTAPKPPAPVRPGCPAITIGASSTQVKITWPAVPNATSYVVKRNNVIVGSPTTASFVDSTSHISTGYSYLVTAKGSTGLESTGCVAKKNVISLAPACPKPVLGISGNNVKVTWPAVSGATKYTVKRGTSTVSTQTGLTFTDASADKTAAHTFTVNSTNANGLISSGCAAVTHNPILDAPKFINSTVTVTGVLPTDWGTSVKTPGVDLNWTAVKGAKSYKLERQTRSMATGAITKAYTQVQNTTATKHSLPAASFNAKYEWKVSAVSGATTKPSTVMTTITHPDAATGVATKASYGVANNKLGDNTVSWTKKDGATGYHVYRVSGTTHTKLATITGTSYIDAGRAYGSTETYWVAPYNNGLRGVNATGVALTSQRSAPAPTSASTSKAAQLNQLQFPPAPAVTSVSATGSRDNDGSNTIKWAKSNSATGYFLNRQSWDLSSSVCMTSKCAGTTGGTSASTVSAADTTVKPGSQYNYEVMAYNATGINYSGHTQKVRLTQRPSKPALAKTLNPSASSVKFDYTVHQNADAGSTGFCATNGGCALQTVLDGVTKAGTYTKVAGAKTEISSSGSWGKAHAVKARTKNSALTNSGYSDYSETTFNQHPGDFTLKTSAGRKDGSSPFRVMLEQQAYPENNKPAPHAFKIDTIKHNGSMEGTSFKHLANGKGLDDDTYTMSRNGYTTSAWGASSGAKSTGAYKLHISPSLSSDTKLLQNVGYDSNKGGWPVGKTHTSTHSAAGSTERYAAYGETYKSEIEVTAASGIKRTKAHSVTTKAGLPRKMWYQYVCSDDKGAQYAALRAYTATGVSHMPISGGFTSVVTQGKGKSNALPYWEGNSAEISGYSSPVTTTKTRGESTLMAPAISTAKKWAKSYGYLLETQTLNTGSPASIKQRYRSRHVGLFSECQKTTQKTVTKMKESSTTCYGYYLGTCWGVNKRPFATND